MDFKFNLEIAAEIECQLSREAAPGFGLASKSPALLEFLFLKEKKLLMFFL